MKIVWEIVAVIFSISLFIVVFFSIYMYNQSKNDFINSFKYSSTREIIQAENTIEIFFESLKENVKLLSILPELIEIDEDFTSFLISDLEGKKTLPVYDSDIEKNLLSRFEDFLQTHSKTTMVYFGTKWGGYIEYPIIPIGSDYDPRIRPWYLKAMENPGEVSLTDPYITLFSENPQIGAVVTVNDKDNNIIGVQGINISLELLSKIIGKIIISQSGFLIITDKNGKVLANPISSKFNFQDISEISEDFSDELFSENNQEVLKKIKLDNEVYYLFSTTATSLSWHFYALVKETEILGDLANRTNIIIIMLLLTIIIIIIYASIVGNTVAKPIMELSKSLEELGKGNFKIRVPKMHGKEIGKMAETFNFMAEELEDSFEDNKQSNLKLEEINAVLEENNLELTNSNKMIKEYSKKIEEITSITSRMSNSAMKKDETFLKDLLEMLIFLVPKADYGSISIIEGDKWRFIHSIGHSIDKLSKLDLKASYFISPLENIALVENIIEFDKSIMSPEAVKALKEATKPVSSSIISRLNFGGWNLGGISLDIAISEEKHFTKEEIKMVKAFSNVASAFLTMQNFMNQKSNFQQDLVKAMVRILEIHDPYTRGHSESVAYLSEKTALSMGFEKEAAERVYWAGLVHDIGKILIPSQILTKPEKLTREEFALIKEHPGWGWKVLETFEDLKDVAQFVKYHHERMDGSGYPENLYGEEIPLVSRILSVADSFDAMTSDRTYKKKISIEEAKNELRVFSAKQFDPEVVEAFIKIIPEIKRDSAS